MALAVCIYLKGIGSSPCWAYGIYLHAFVTPANRVSVKSPHTKSNTWCGWWKTFRHFIWLVSDEIFKFNDLQHEDVGDDEAEDNLSLACNPSAYFRKMENGIQINNVKFRVSSLCQKWLLENYFYFSDVLLPRSCIFLALSRLCLTYIRIFYHIDFDLASEKSENPFLTWLEIDLMYNTNIRYFVKYL